MSSYPLIFLILTLATRLTSVPTDDDPAKVRKEITEQYAAWGKARVGFDTATYQRMLTPDFYCQLPDKKLTRQEFIDEISKQKPNVEFKRMDSNILTLTKAGDGWVAVISEKLEFRVGGDNGATKNYYSFWVTRDGWNHGPDGWKIGSTEAIGFQVWKDELPPIPGWNQG